MTPCLKEVAPSPELRTWFGHDPARWTEFSRRHRSELKNDEAVGRLGDLLKRGRVTLLYAPPDPTHNHVLVLAAYMRDRLKDRHDAHVA